MYDIINPFEGSGNPLSKYGYILAQLESKTTSLYALLNAHRELKRLPPWIEGVEWFIEPDGPEFSKFIYGWEKTEEEEEKWLASSWKEDWMDEEYLELYREDPETILLESLEYIQYNDVFETQDWNTFRWTRESCSLSRIEALRKELRGVIEEYSTLDRTIEELC